MTKQRPYGEVAPFERLLYAPTEQPGYTYWECADCGFDAVTLDRAMEAKSTPICPLCAGDNGRDVEMRSRVARADDAVEGKDARKA